MRQPRLLARTRSMFTRIELRVIGAIVAVLAGMHAARLADQER